MRVGIEERVAFTENASYYRVMALQTILIKKNILFRDLIPGRLMPRHQF